MNTFIYTYGYVKSSSIGDKQGGLRSTIILLNRTKRFQKLGNLLHAYCSNVKRRKKAFGDRVSISIFIHVRIHNIYIYIYIKYDIYIYIF